MRRLQEGVVFQKRAFNMLEVGRNIWRREQVDQADCNDQIVRYGVKTMSYVCDTGT